MTIDEVRKQCEELYPSDANVSARALDIVWKMAWDIGHAYGASEVLSHYCDFVEIAQVAATDAASKIEGL